MSEMDSRSRILEAALDEFAAVGFAGARVDTIARLAGCNKQLLYHYFKDKNGLYEAVIERAMSSRPPIDFSSREPMGDQCTRVFEELMPKRQRWLRLLMWEALSIEDRELSAEKIRKEHAAQSIDDVKKAQDRGILTSEFEAPYIMLAMMSMCMYVFAFPQVVRVITGRSVADPEFRRNYLQVIRRMARTFLKDPPSAV